MLIAMIVNEDEDHFKEKLDLAYGISVKNSDVKFLNKIKILFNSIKCSDEKRFNDNLVDITYEYPNEICKKLKNLFMGRIKNRESGDHNPMIKDGEDFK